MHSVSLRLMSDQSGLHRVDTMGKLMSPTAMKRRGLKVGGRTDGAGGSFGHSGCTLCAPRMRCY